MVSIVEVEESYETHILQLDGSISNDCYSTDILSFRGIYEGSDSAIFLHGYMMLCRLSVLQPDTP